MRVHADAHADGLSRSIQAEAFTRGRDIYVAGGQYAPNSMEGKRLLAHELTHVVQQNGQGSPKVRGIMANSSLVGSIITSRSSGSWIQINTGMR